MRRSCEILCLLVTLFSVTGPVWAADRCMNVGDTALFKVKTWDELGVWWEGYPECDDGYLAEHVSELVTTWLAKEPDSITALSRAIESHATLRPLALKHIDITASVEAIQRIQQHASDACPDGAADLCRAILARIEDLDEEVARVRRAKD